MAGNNFQSSKTHCPAGHEYTEANTKLIKSSQPGRFKRQCRACKADAAKRYAEAKKKAARSAEIAASGIAIAP